MTPKEVVSQIRNGDTIVIGGWGMDRKPMTILREIAKSKLKDLTIMSYAGLDIDLLIGAGKVKKFVFPFVSLEGAPGTPGNYRRARREGSIEIMEVSEYMFLCGLRAAAERLPFMPCRNGLGTDILKANPEIKTIKAPYSGETLVAMPALKADVALLHVNAADPSGYAQIQADRIFDHIISRGPDKVFISAEKIVPLTELKCNYSKMEILKNYVTGVVEAPYGAHPGWCWPHYENDEKHLAEYSKASATQESFNEYLDKYVKGAPDQETYLKLVGKV